MQTIGSKGKLDARLRCAGPQPRPFAGRELPPAVREESRLTGHDEKKPFLLHGVLLRVCGLGVLLAGPSGIGKSVLALELLARGHTLVADDAVEIRRIASGRLVGQAPGGRLIGQSPLLLRGFMEVRGLGILQVPRLYGKSAVRARQRLDLIIRLTRGQGRLTAAARLAGRRSTQRLLGQKVPVLSLSAGTGHNLPALVEAASLDQRLRLSGFAADRVFAQRQQKAIERE